MKQYVINIMDDAKSGQLLALLNDLPYVKISEPKAKDRRFTLMNNPLPVDDFKRFSREELHER